MPPERVVQLRPRTVLQVAGLLVGVALALWVVWISIRVITWVFVALFLALALDPAVRLLQAKGLADAFPGYVEDVTAGRGPLGFLERDYQVVEKVREATKGGGSFLGGA